jgi:hypothetical protein
MGSRRALPLKANHLSNVLDGRLAYEIGQLLSAKV